MTLRTTSAVVGDDWMVARDAPGYPTVVSGSDVEVFISVPGGGGFSTSGLAYATLGVPDAVIPSGITPTLTHITFTGQGNGGYIAPIAKFNRSDDPTANIFEWAQIGAGGPGYSLAGITSPVFLDYDSSVSGSMLVDDPRGFYDAAMVGGAVALVFMQSGPSPFVADGDSLTYIAPITVTWAWDDGVTSTPERMYPRWDDRGASPSPRNYPPPPTRNYPLQP